MAPYPSGKGEVCKTFMQQFDSARRLVYSRSGNPGAAFFLLLSKLLKTATKIVEKISGFFVCDVLRDLALENPRGSVCVLVEETSKIVITVPVT